MNRRPMNVTYDYVRPRDSKSLLLSPNKYERLENWRMTILECLGKRIGVLGLMLGVFLLTAVFFFIKHGDEMSLIGHSFAGIKSTTNYHLTVQTFRQRKCPAPLATQSNVTCKQPIIDFRPYLVIPVYRSHFDAASRFLQTFIKNVVDLDRIDIQMILSDDKEVSDFIARMRRDNIEFEKMNLQFWSFRKLLQSLGVDLYEGWDTFSNKLPYLSLKKLAGLSISKKWQYALIIDCEAIIRKSTNFTEVFLDFFISPYMFYENAKIHKWLTDGSREALRMPDSALPSRDTFVGQYHGWFLERSIFDDLLKHLLHNSSDLLRWAHSVPNFSNEYMYHFWLLWNRDSIASHYTFIDIPKLLETFLPEEIMKRSYPAWSNRILPQGSFECLYCWATPEIIDLLNPFFTAYKLTFYDYHADYTNELGDCTLNRLLDTVSSMRVQATSQSNSKGTWNKLNCSKFYVVKKT